MPVVLKRDRRARVGAQMLCAALCVVGATVSFSSGCAMVTGVDFGKAHLAEPDGGAAINGEDGAATTEGGVNEGDGGNGASACTPDPNSITCADKCGTTDDNCKAPRLCSTDCGEGRNCTNGTCECVSNGQWCTNRCGTANDNCGRPVKCGGCEAGLCSDVGTCNGCVPENLAKTCGTKNCGTATNNCGQLVACGTNGACASGVCKSDGSCCVDDGLACNGKCGGVTVTNNCGQNVGCPAQCPATQVCMVTQCCAPEPLATTCSGVACGPKTNNCGQAVTCPNTCVTPQTCGGGGAGVNGCGCTPNNPCGNRCGGTLNDSCGNPVQCSADCQDLCPCAGGYCGGVFCVCNGGRCR